MRQRILDSHTPPCHRCMVITTQFNARAASRSTKRSTHARPGMHMQQCSAVPLIRWFHKHLSVCTGCTDVCHVTLLSGRVLSAITSSLHARGGGGAYWGTRCPIGEPMMRQASAIHLLDFAMGPRDYGSFHLTPVIALASLTGALPVRLRLRYLRRIGLPEVASARSRGPLAGVPLVFCLAGLHPGRRTLCCGVDSHDSNNKKASTKEESDHGASVCVSAGHGADSVSGSGDSSPLRALLGLLSSCFGLRART